MMGLLSTTQEGLIMQAFHSTGFAHKVIFAVGALEQLGKAVEDFGWQRLLLCTSPSQQSAGHVSRIAAALSSRLVAIYERVQLMSPNYWCFCKKHGRKGGYYSLEQRY